MLGVSWLYNLGAYTRLFPPAYAASARLPAFPVHMNGSSTWGQVLTWRGTVKPAVRDAVVAKLAAIDPAAPWKVFPLRALAATAAIGVFHDGLAATRAAGDRAGRAPSATALRAG